jgi:predicted RNA binding protein YcfA (HicA-like mRNA interferase family)
MKQLSGKELCRIVEQRGWQLLRITGSHHIYGRPNQVTRLTIPVHADRPLKTGLLRHLLKQAGISETEM